MQTPTFRIVGPSGATLADDLPIQAPAIQLHEGTIAEPAAPYPKELASGEFTTVVYPLDAERGRRRPTIVSTVIRTDAPENVETKSEARATVAPTETEPKASRGGRRSRGGKS